MKKIPVFVIVLFLVLTGVFAQAISSDVGKEVGEYVKSFLEKEGIERGEIQEIVEINQNNLPNEVEIKEIDENNIGIYEVSYLEENQENKIFVVTYATNEFEKKEDYKNINYLNFGFAESSSESAYLESSNVQGNKNIGYVMMRPGSITGISTSLNLEGQGELEIKIYINGEDTGFRNVISSDDSKKMDYDLQSERVLDYNPGDVISVYVEKKGELSWSNAVTLVETTS